MRLPKILAAVLLLSGIWPFFVGQVPAQPAPERLNAPDLPKIPHRYTADPLPAHVAALSALDNTPAGNPITDAGATLGRVIFYDHGLSRNRLVACATCHTQALGFDDPTKLSIGFEGKITRRASMTLTNARFQKRGKFFRDERADTLEEQVLHPFTDEIEMGLAEQELVEKIDARNWYGPLFADTFGDAEVTEARIAAALAQFVRSIVSYRAPYDKARAQVDDPHDPFPQFNDLQNRGKELFLLSREQGGAGCASCHQSEAFVVPEPRNNGLTATLDAPDNGVGEITGKNNELGLFRPASLRNIAVTAPYMHDGRFATLEAVIEHYSGSVKPHPNLSPQLRADDGSPVRLDLSVEDRAALIAFLETLTDDELLRDERFTDPFQKPR